MWLMHVTQQNSMDDMDHQTADGCSDIEQTSKAEQRSSCTPRNALNQAMIYLVHTHSWIYLETIPENMVTGSGAWSGR